MPTGIEYCDETLEVTGGCTKCSPGCQHCWAIKEVWRMAHNPNMGDKWKGLVEMTEEGLNWTGKIKCFYDALDIPIHRKKPTRYFIDSKADLFHRKVSIGCLTHVFDTIKQCPQHTFLILTKRPEQALKMMWPKRGWRYFGKGDYHPNIHFGVSISNPDEMWKAKVLADIPAAVRWLSLEPMLEGTKLPTTKCDFYDHIQGSSTMAQWKCPKCGRRCCCNYVPECLCADWVVCGGESGPGARPMHPDCPRNLRDQCVAAGVPFFFKQWGEWLPGSHAQNFSDEQLSHYKMTLLEHNGNGVAMFRVGKKKAGRILDGKIWNQYPAEERKK